MNKLSQAFAKGKAFIPFVTAGDPSLEVTEDPDMEYRVAHSATPVVPLGEVA